MAAPVPFTVSGAFGGAPVSAVPVSASWFYVTIQDVTERTSSLMAIASKSADTMSIRAKVGSLLSIRTR